jgi:hypothetical protein
MDLGSKIVASSLMSSVAAWCLGGGLRDLAVGLVAEATPSRLLPILLLAVLAAQEATKAVVASEVASKAGVVSVEVSEAIEAGLVIGVDSVAEVALATKAATEVIEVIEVGMVVGLEVIKEVEVRPMAHPAAEVAMAVVRMATIEEMVGMEVATIVASQAATESPLATETAATTTEIETVTEIDMEVVTDATTITRESDLAKTMGMTILANGDTDHRSLQPPVLLLKMVGWWVSDSSSLTFSRFDQL